MTVAFVARDENHGRRANLRHEERIVVGAADHALHGVAEFFCDAFRCLDNISIADRGRIKIQPLHREFNLAARADFFHGAFDLNERGITRLYERVAQVDLQPRTAGNTVHRAGFNAKYAGRADRVGAASGRRGLLDGKRDFCAGEQRIAATGHERCACVAADAS